MDSNNQEKKIELFIYETDTQEEIKIDSLPSVV
jgi:hypothetical protein